MLRQSPHAIWIVALAPLLSATGLVSGQEKRPDVAAEKAARDTLAQIANGDPGWKARMETLVGLVRAGPAAVPLLEQAVKQGSPAVRALATQVLAVIRGPEAVRRAVTGYDLAKLDSARLGQVAPDFSLTDLSGKGYRLRQFRDRKAVVLTFFMDDG
ncbi:MAG TPA: hypothetical protein VKD72_36990 [Gemmataceae bacterium]|nr:hypothetical protein [Gemmataceae bacterium]